MLNVQKNKIENDIIQKIIDINYSTIKIILRFSLDEERERQSAITVYVTEIELSHSMCLASFNENFNYLITIKSQPILYQLLRLF